jgi:hypothetical protein
MIFEIFSPKNVIPESVIFRQGVNSYFILLCWINFKQLAVPVATTMKFVFATNLQKKRNNDGFKSYCFRNR